MTLEEWQCVGWCEEKLGSGLQLAHIEDDPTEGDASLDHGCQIAKDG